MRQTILAAALPFVLVPSLLAAQDPATPSAAATPAEHEAAPSTAPEDGSAPLSLARIRARLDQPSAAGALTSRSYDPTAPPTYRVEIFAPRSLLVPFAESLTPAWQAIVPGGLWHKEFMDMVTPPQARPFGAFQNLELLQVAASSFANAMVARAATKGVKAALTSARRREVARIRREVEEELAAVRRAGTEPGEAPANATGQPPGPK